jgi:hypothetical protein
MAFSSGDGFSLQATFIAFGFFIPNVEPQVKRLLIWGAYDLRRHAQLSLRLCSGHILISLLRDTSAPVNMDLLDPNRDF